MSNYIKIKLNILKQNQKQLILFSLVYVVGLILGIFFLGKLDEGSILYVNTNNYYVLIFDTSVSIFSIFLKCLISGILLSIPLILLGLSIFTIPFICIVILYRGIILGSALILFYSVSGISGVIIFIILTLPMHVCITAGLIISSVLNYGIKKSCKGSSRFFEVFKNALISIAFTLIASIYIVFLMITVIRPINLLI